MMLSLPREAACFAVRPLSLLHVACLPPDLPSLPAAPPHPFLLPLLKQGLHSRPQSMISKCICSSIWEVQQLTA